MVFVGSPLSARAAKRPRDPALSCGSRVWAWDNLETSVGRRAAAVSSAYPKGARIGLDLADPAELLIAFLAVARAGHMAMIFDPGWPMARREAVVNAVRPDGILDTSAFDDVGAGSWCVPGQARVRSEMPAADDLFYVGFTSGSTGLPKGFCRSHGSWLASFDVSAAEFPIGPHDHVLIPGSLQHSLHLYGAVHAVHVGARVSLAPRFDPKALVRMLAGGGVSVLYATPTQLHYLDRELGRTGAMAGPRLVLASGAKWRAEDRRDMARRFPDARLVEFYGASETSFIAVSGPEEPVPDGSVGRTAAGVRVRIGPPGGSIPAGDPGPIWVKSPMLFSRYLCGSDDSTRWRDGWLTVGDHGYLDEDGFLYLTGREGRMIVTSGLNIYPEEVEKLLETHPGVDAAAVFGLADEVRGQKLVAAVKPAHGTRVSEDGLRRHCLTALGRSRTPRRFHVTEPWPLTAGGKTDLKKLKALLTKENGPGRGRRP
ncbi:MAG: AMP-binding protein [Roseibium sp.]|nr:AMP-binding protein [Roseibium sp.]